MGRDYVIDDDGNRTGDFNSHARVGRDTDGVSVSGVEVLYFNSHARVGRDSLLQYLSTDLRLISTHTPAWGATWFRGYYR